MYYVNVRHSDGTVFIRTYSSKQAANVETVFQADNYAEAEAKAIQVANDMRRVRGRDRNEQEDWYRE